MYYGQGYAGADDVVGHEMTHGVTERTSSLFYWGQSGAINESISDIIGEIVDHRHASSGDVADATGRSVRTSRASRTGSRNMADPTAFGDPDKMSSASLRPETCADPRRLLPGQRRRAPQLRRRQQDRRT